MKKLHFALMAVAVAAMPATARQLTPEEALQAASLLPEASSKMKAPAAMKLAYTQEIDGFRSCYVFNRGENAGFVILSADDAVTPMLGYADAGNFDYDNIPTSMKWLLESYADQISYAAANPAAAEISRAYKAPSSWTPVEPICTTQWDQDAPYNIDCPTINGKATLTGCVATAMAQVMKAHNWPVKGTGSKSYSYNRDGYTVNVSTNFGSHTYDWKNMLNKYPSGQYNDTQAKAVAQLMFDCGVAANMSFGTSSSGAITMRGAMGMIDYLGYDKAMSWIYRSSNYLPEWNRLVYEEVKAGRPVLLSGQNPEGGHAFVADGYSSDYYFHINWGWNGISDGYFLLSVLDPFEQGNGGTTGGYAEGLAGLFGCKPAVAGSQILPRVKNDGGLALARQSYLRTSSVAFGSRETTVYTTTTLAPLTATLGVQLENVETGEKTYLWSSTKFDNSLPGSGYYYFSISGQKFPREGKYNLTAVFQTDDEKIYPIDIDIQGPLAQVAECTNDRIIFTPVYPAGDTRITKFEDYGGIALGQNAVFTTTFTTTCEEFNGNITPQILKLDGTLVTSGAAQNISAVAGTPLVYDWFVNFPQTALAEGDYKVAFKDIKRNVTFGEYPVKILPNPGTLAYSPATFSVDIEKGKWSQSNPAVVNRASNVTVSIPVSSGQFARPICLAWGNQGGKIQGETPYVIVVGRKGETIKHTFVEPFANASTPEKYYSLMIMSVDDSGKDIRLSDFGSSKRIWFTLTGESGVEDIIADGGNDAVALYPNPVENTANFSGNAITEIRIYSIAGTLMLSVDGNGENAISVDASALASGHYIAMVTTADGVVAKRMIKR